MTLRLQVIPFAALVMACESEVCVTPPCPLSRAALSINVTSAVAGVPLSGVFGQVTKPSQFPATCVTGATATNCMVFGEAGHYEVQLGAAGFQTVTRAVDVTGNTPRCGCATVNTVTLDVQLTPQ